MNLVKVSPLLFLVVLTFASILEAVPKDDPWFKDYTATKRAISRSVGDPVSTPTNTFMNLSHFLKMLKEDQATSIVEDPQLDLEMTQRLVKVAEFHKKNCNRTRFLEIRKLDKFFDDFAEFYNISVYMKYIKRRMEQLCVNAFEQGDLPIEL